MDMLLDFLVLGNDFNDQQMRLIDKLPVGVQRRR